MRSLAHARVITPNVREASVLVGRELRSIDDLADAARELGKTGAQIVVVKGGHLDGADAVDVVWTGDELHELGAPRFDTPNVHGTGCTFASAIAARLARGDEPLAAIKRAKRYLTTALASGAEWHLGAGHGPVNHFAAQEQEDAAS